MLANPFVQYWHFVENSSPTMFIGPPIVVMILYLLVAGFREGAGKNDDKGGLLVSFWGAAMVSMFWMVFPPIILVLLCLSPIALVAYGLYLFAKKLGRKYLDKAKEGGGE